MLLYTSPEHGCVYSMCSEGVLYYTPQYRDNTVVLDDNFEGEWCEVDFMALMGEDEEVQSEIKEIETKLISALKAMGEYYQTA